MTSAAPAKPAWRRRARLLGLALLPLAWLAQWGAGYAPELVESWYSRGLFRWVHGALAAVVSIFPFAVGEWLVVGAIVAGVIHSVLAVRAVRAGHARWWRQARTSAGTAVVSAGVVYAVFLLVWGLNYARVPFAEQIGLEVRDTDVEELASLAEELIAEANSLRDAVPESADGSVVLEDGAAGVLARLEEAYAAAQTVYPALAGPRIVARTPLASSLLSSAGLGGMYSPFSAEANVNGHIPPAGLPFTACHEAAHARGFAREDEANFIAALVCRAASFPEFRYAGARESLDYVMRALGRLDGDRARLLAKTIAEPVLRDYRTERAFWAEAVGVLSDVSRTMNDTYLKAHGTPDGIASYGRMVDLLLAERRARRGATDSE